jgi:hypothetical protein
MGSIRASGIFRCGFCWLDWQELGAPVGCLVGLFPGIVWVDDPL